MMQAHEIIFNYLGKLMKLPIRGLLFTFALTFSMAVGLSVVIYRMVLPQVSADLSKYKDNESEIKEEGPTLQDNMIKVIVARNIFNKSGEIPKEDMRDENAAYKGEEAIKSQLPLRLRGMIYTGNPQTGLALIENTDLRKQNSFLVGDRVTKESELLEVQEDRIILKVNDHKEFIEMPTQYVQRRRRNRRPGGSGNANVAGSLKYSENGFERDGNKISMSSDFRQKLLTTDFAKVLQDAKAEPVYEGGELNGFRLTRIRPDSVYEKGGLLNDDVVKEINGVSLVDTAQAIKLLNSLRGANEIVIGLNRGGQKLNVNIQVK